MIFASGGSLLDPSECPSQRGTYRVLERHFRACGKLIISCALSQQRHSPPAVRTCIDTVDRNRHISFFLTRPTDLAIRRYVDVLCSFFLLSMHPPQCISAAYVRLSATNGRLTSHVAFTSRQKDCNINLILVLINCIVTMTASQPRDSFHNATRVA